MVRLASLLPSRNSNISEFVFGKKRLLRPRGKLEIWSGKVNKKFGDRKSVCYKSHTTVLKENDRADYSPQ